MAMNFHHVVGLLDQHIYTLRCYRDPQRVRNDCVELIKTNPALVPARGQLARATPSGPVALAELLKLVGTIPVIYNNSQYNIPIEVWLPESYPLAPPVCRVTPTKDMIIKPRHFHVDTQGAVYLHYLTSWNAVGSHLVGLVTQMARAFGEDPPVRALPTNQQAPANSFSPPPPHPHPPNYYSTPQQYFGSSSAGTASSSSPSPPQYQPPPSTVPRPLPYPITQAAAYESMPLPAPLPSSSAFPSPPVPSSAAHPLPPPSLHPGPYSHFTPPLPKPAPPALSPATPAAAPPEPAPPAQPPAEEEASLMSFQTTSEDPVVLHRNLVASLTERTQQRMKSFFVQTTAEIDELMDAHQASAKKLADSELPRLQETKAKLDRELADLSRQLSQAEAWLQANDKPQFDIDAATEPKDGVSRQLVHLIAEDAALDDALYQLEQLLAAGKLDLPMFLKSTRSLARDQFIARATIKKVTERLNERAAAAQARK